MIDLLPHQEVVLPKLATGKVLVGGTGSGKSITALSYFQKHPSNVIYVLTTAKKRDSGEWWEDAMKMGLMQDLVVDSWNNIAKYEDVENACFILDEQRIVGNGAWVDSFYKIAAKNDWILLSATPADTYMDLVPLFVANGFFKNKTQFNREHVVFSRFAKYPKVDRYVDTWLLDQYRNQIYVEMPFEKQTKREEHIVSVDFDLDEQRKLYMDRWNIYEHVPLKDAGEMVRLMRKSANSHPSRYAAVKKLCEENPRAIIFFRTTGFVIFEISSSRALTWSRVSWSWDLMSG